MPINRDTALALEIPGIEIRIDRSRLVFFAKAVAQTDPVYIDVEAARAAGHPDLPVPPSFYFSLALECPEPFAFLTPLGLGIEQFLHGEQSFEYFALAHAGDTIRLESRISDVYSKRGGTLEFLVRETAFRRGHDEVATMTTVLVARNLDGAE